MIELNIIYSGEENIKSERNTQTIIHRNKVVNMKEKLRYMKDIISITYLIGVQDEDNRGKRQYLKT